MCFQAKLSCSKVFGHGTAGDNIQAGVEEGGMKHGRGDIQRRNIFLIKFFLNGPVSVAEAAKASGLNKRTVHRYLVVLQEFFRVEKVGHKPVKFWIVG